jgi:uncharacterized protein YcaQ
MSPTKSHRSRPKNSGPSITLSLAEARHIALRAQGLAEAPAPFGLGKPAVLRAIQHLGYVQVDTISVLQRAHHHVLWSRVPDYEPDMLHELQSPDGAVFEYWNHAASYLAMSDFRFSLPLMRKYRRERHWSDPTPELESAMRRIKRLVRRAGAFKISDVESTGTAGGWFKAAPDKIERRALHELWMGGEIMIHSRQGFQKVYDLPGKIIPPSVDLTRPTDREAAAFHVRRALRALGIARLPELHYLQDAGRASEGRAALAKLVKAGNAVELRITEHPDIPVFALREALEWAAPMEQALVRFLSPFDNLTIQRKRLKWLFDFDYTVEIYVPAAKRKYGYFVLPVLWGDRMIARMDAKANRPTRELLIHNLVFEPSCTAADWKAAKPSFLEAVRRFADFQQCDTWKVTRIEPAGFRVG